jgi:putative ABC transport system substrate-binding protein
MAFRQGLRELGHIEGQSLVIENRFIDDSIEKLPAYAAELVSLPVDVIVTTGVEATQAARQATATIPIVGAVLGPDPVGTGMAASLAQPGGNVTGLSAGSGRGISAKRLEILHDIVPTMRSVGALWTISNPDKAIEFREVDDAARQRQVQVISAEIRDRDVEAALRKLADTHPDTLIVFQDPVTAGAATRITSFATEQRMPAMYTVRLWSDAGGLLMYGIDTTVLFRLAPYYVDRILKGARPGDLPIEQPNAYELRINLKAAQAIGLTIPASVLSQAAEIIQ